MSAESIAVVAATYNRCGALAAFVEPLLAQGEADEVIVVVDGSEDGSIGYLEGLAERDPRLRAVFSDHAGQFGALETGVRLATSDVVLLMDDDVIAEPGLVAGHLAHHRDDDLVVLGYMPPRPIEHRAAGDFSIELYAKAYERRCRSYDHDPSMVLRHLWGGNISIGRERCLAVGLAPGFGDDLPSGIRIYHEDRAFGLRCARAGLRGVFDRSLRAVHDYRRPIEALRRDYRGQGSCEVLLARTHPEALEPFTVAQLEDGLPAPIAWAQRTTSRWPWLYRGSTGVLMGCARLAGRLRCWPLERLCGRVLRPIELRRGADQVLTAGR